MTSETHGGLDLGELRQEGVDPRSLIDFSVNVNPYGPSPRVLTALRAFDPAPYPDREALLLREALAEANGVEATRVLCGNGTAELIWVAVHAFLRRGERALIVGPTFGEYERAAGAVGAQVERLAAAPPVFHLEVDEIVAAIRRLRPRVVFLCNPNNPTGLILAEPEVQQVAQACGGGTLILDEAYRSFVNAAPFAPTPAPNVIVLRSLTKDCALAGLRLGYALAGPALLGLMCAFQPPWSVSGAAQAAGLAALADREYLVRTLALTAAAARGLRTALAARGARIVPAATHFLLIDVGDGRALRRALLAQGCLVRDCASFGLPGYIRVGARTPEENARLIAAWPEANG